MKQGAAFYLSLDREHMNVNEPAPGQIVNHLMEYGAVRLFEPIHIGNANDKVRFLWPLPVTVYLLFH